MRITRLRHYTVLFLLPSLVGHITADFPIHLPIEKREWFDVWEFEDFALRFSSSKVLMVSHVTSEGSECLHAKTSRAQIWGSNAPQTEQEIYLRMVFQWKSCEFWLPELKCQCLAFGSILRASRCSAGQPIWNTPSYFPYVCHFLILSEFKFHLLELCVPLLVLRVLCCGTLKGRCHSEWHGLVGMVCWLDSRTRWS